MRPRVLVGKTPQIVEVYKLVARAALSPSPVLLQGERGTGKSMVARAIHENSERQSSKLVVWNATAQSSAGDLSLALAEARGGTLYLEDVGELPSAVQLELLRVLEQEDSPFRIIAATPVSLNELAAQGSFREDLLYQLQVIRVDLPPLRDRIEDLPELVETFLVRYSEKNRKSISHVTEEAMKLLKGYSWPGNVRELEHAVERAVAISNSSVLFPEDFSALRESEKVHKPSAPVASMVEQSPILAGEASLEELEKLHILKVLREVHFNKSKASEILGIDRVTLYRKAQRYGIDLRGKG